MIIAVDPAYGDDWQCTAVFHFDEAGVLVVDRIEYSKRSPVTIDGEFTVEES